jgi:hypothetical protein
VDINASVQLGLEQALKALIPYLQQLEDPAGVWNFLDFFPPGFLYLAGHEATDLPDNETAYLAFIAGLPSYRMISPRYPMVPLKAELATAGIGDEKTRADAVIKHSQRTAALIQLFSPRYYETLREVLNERSELLATFGPSDVNVPQNKFTLQGHGLTNDTQIRFLLGAPGNSLPAPLVEEVIYFVINAAGNSFKVSDSLGGPEIVITDSGQGTNEIWEPPDLRPWKGLGFDAWNAEVPQDGRAPTGNAFIANPSYFFLVHFEIEPMP